ncbi:MAG: 30S ribosomal protein S6 [Nitratireductor sp.]
MALYEFTLLARQDISAQQAEALVEHFTGVLEANEGKVSKFENWGLRTSAHKIKKNRKAHYLFLHIDASAAAMAEMERQLRIHEDVLRFLSIRVEEHEEEPSAMMRKSDRDDRGPRRDRDSRPPRDNAPRDNGENKAEKAETPATEGDA